MIARLSTLLLAGLVMAGSGSRVTAQGARQPISLLLLVDVSASVDFRSLELPRDASGIVDSSLLARLTAADRFGVAGFGATTRFSGVLPGDRRGRLTAVRAVFRDRSVGLNGPSRIWDAVDEAVGHLEREPVPRALILMTDGRGSGNRVGLDAVIRRAATAAVRVSVVASGSVRSSVTRDRHPELEPHLALERLTRDTGGVFFVDDVGDRFRPREPGRYLEDIVTRLRGDDVAPSR